MNKISLKNLNLKEVEQLSREQLKDVLSGWTNLTTMVPCEQIISNCNAAASECTKNLFYDDRLGANNDAYWTAMQKCASHAVECFGDCTTTGYLKT